jgi:TPR repeat protein
VSSSTRLGKPGRSPEDSGLRAPARHAIGSSIMAQTRHGIPQEFLDAADQFVDLANKLGDQYPRDWVCAVLMYAAARYNAFVWHTRDEGDARTLDAAVAYYASEYDKMLRDNVDELEPVYRNARGSGKPAN